jgi:hypothetical protein
MKGRLGGRYSWIYNSIVDPEYRAWHREKTQRRNHTAANFLRVIVLGVLTVVAWVWIADLLGHPIH